MKLRDNGEKKATRKVGEKAKENEKASNRKYMKKLTIIRIRTLIFRTVLLIKKNRFVSIDRTRISSYFTLSRLLPKRFRFLLKFLIRRQTPNLVQPSRSGGVITISPR